MYYLQENNILIFKQTNKVVLPDDIVYRVDYDNIKYVISNDSNRTLKLEILPEVLYLELPMVYQQQNNIDYERSYIKNMYNIKLEEILSSGEVLYGDLNSLTPTTIECDKLYNDITKKQYKLFADTTQVYKYLESKYSLEQNILKKLKEDTCEIFKKQKLTLEIDTTENKQLLSKTKNFISAFSICYNQWIHLATLSVETRN